MPDDFTPDSDDFEPDPEEERGFFGSAWDWLNRPLSGGAIRRNIADPFAEFMYETGNKYAKTPLVNYAYGLGAGAQAVGDQLDLMTSPGQLALMGMTGGASHYASAGRAAQRAGRLSESIELANKARMLEAPGRVAGLGMVGHGGYRAYTGTTTEDMLSGGLEAVLGGLGTMSVVRGVPKIDVLAPEMKGPTKMLSTRMPEPPIDVTPKGPRFYAGEAGVAENRPYNIDIDSPLPGDMRSGSGTVLPREYGGLVAIPPDLAARRGVGGLGVPRQDVGFNPQGLLPAGGRFISGSQGTQDNYGPLGFDMMPQVEAEPNLPAPSIVPETPNVPEPTQPHALAGLSPEQIREKLGINKLMGKPESVPTRFADDGIRIGSMEEDIARVAERRKLIETKSQTDFVINEADPPFIQNMKQRANTLFGELRQKGELPYLYREELQRSINTIAEHEATMQPRVPDLGSSISEMRVPGTRNVAIGGADPEVLDMLSTALYAKQDPPATVAKEGLQNSADELKISGKPGPIKIAYDWYAKNPQTGDNSRALVVQDGGRGMNFDQLTTIYSDVGKSGKRDNPDASGGFGFAKLAPLLSGEYVQVESITEVDGKIIKYTFEGNPQQLKDQKVGVPVKEEVMPAGTKTGFKTVTYFPETRGLSSAKMLIDETVSGSPGMDHIEIYEKTNSSIPEKQNLVDFLNNPTSVKGKPLKGLKWTPKQDTITTPSAEIDIHFEPDAVERSGGKMTVLNNGMFVKQEDANYVWGKTIPNAPGKMIVNIKPTVEEGQKGYAFGLNREEINTDIMRAIRTWINDKIIKPGEAQKTTEVQDVYDALVPASGNSYVILDSGNKYTAKELAHLENSPSMARISEVMGGILSQLRGVLDDVTYFETEKFGIRAAENNRGGINITSKGGIATNGKGLTTILINPFSAINMSRTPREAADRMVHIILHEFAHNIARTEDGDYTWALAQVYNRYDLEEQLHARERILEGLTDKRGVYTPELQKILQEHTDSRGRPAITEDVLSRESESADPTKPAGTAEISDPNKPDGSRTARNIGSSSTAGAKRDRTSASITRANVKAQAESINKLDLVLKTAIQESQPLRNQQEEMYSAERGKRIGMASRVKETGEAGFAKQKALMRGELPKVDALQPIRPLLSQVDIDNLFDTVTASQMDEFKKLRTKVALTKLLDGHSVPQNNEIKLLAETFGDGVAKGISELHGGLGAIPSSPEKIKGFIGNTANFMKSVMASIDLSIPLRNALPGITQGAWWRSLDDMVKAWPSEEFYNATMAAIEDDPYYSLAEAAGVEFLDMGKNVSKRDEAYHSTWAENLKIPGAPTTKADPLQMLSAGIKASNRAAVTFGNKYRMDAFKTLVKKKMDISDPSAISSKDVGQTVKDAKTIARFVNESSGRGNLGAAKKYASELNWVFFSPKNQASRIFFLNPWNYINPENEIIRRQMLKSALGIGGAWYAINTALDQMGGDTQWDDPTTADWAKSIFGKTRVEPSGGFQKFLVAAARMATSQSKSSVSGNVSKFNENFNSPNRGTILQSMMENALSPAASMVVGLITGKDFLNKPFNVRNELIRRMTPIISQDLYDLHQTDPDLVPLGLLSAMGISLNTYTDDMNSPRRPRRPQRPPRPMR